LAVRPEACIPDLAGRERELAGARAAAQLERARIRALARDLEPARGSERLDTIDQTLGLLSAPSDRELGRAKLAGQREQCLLADLAVGHEERGGAQASITLEGFGQRALECARRRNEERRIVRARRGEITPHRDRLRARSRERRDVLGGALD